MRFGIVAIVVFGAFPLVNCHRSPEPPTSLVGATKIPSSVDLRKETIIITRMGGKDAEDLLNIEIWPANDVVAAHYRGSDTTKAVAREKLSVSPDDVERLRRMLWRLRPDDNAPAEKTIPVGCHWVYDAGFEWGVAYLREDRPGNLLEFTLPYPEYCKTPAYLEARELIGAALEALPPSKVIRRFPQGRYHPLGTYSP